MPAPPPITYALLSRPLPHPRPYILDIYRGPSGGSSGDHLLLRHPAPEISIADAQTLQLVDTLRDGHRGNVSAVTADGEQGSIWSASKDARLIRWDERSRRVGMVVEANIRRPLPLTSLAASESDHLVIAGTELQSSEAHILFYDTRNPKQPMYTHSSTHSDDITHLSLLSPTNSFLHRSILSTSITKPLPSRLLLSASTDGLVALSDMRESDEDEAVLCAENWGQSIASAGAYPFKGRLKIWARSDMDNIAMWNVSPSMEDKAIDSDGPIQLDGLEEYSSSNFRQRKYKLPSAMPHVPRQAAEERGEKDASTRTSDYLVDVVPSLGTSGVGGPMVAVGNNNGDIVIQYHHYRNVSSSTTVPTATTAIAPSFEPSAYLLTGPESTRGHADVVRALLHDMRNEAIYTGSEDGVLSGWSLAGMGRLRTGNKEVDDDGGDGREAVESDDEDDESEIVTESSGSRSRSVSDGDDAMDVDGDDGGYSRSGRREEREEGPRYGPILGRGSGGRGGKEKRKDKRHQPY